VQPKEITWHHIMPQWIHYIGKMADHMVESYIDKCMGKPVSEKLVQISL
jgi:hypothetical protein